MGKWSGREPKLASADPRRIFESALERIRQAYELCVYGYVVMPEHVHLLVSEPERGTLAQAVQSLKQGVARRLALRAEESFWQARYYDFNVWSERKFKEKLRYIHRNPVTRGLVARAEDSEWSSFHHYWTGAAGVVEIAIAVDGAVAGEDGDISHAKGKGSGRKSPPKQSLDGAPSRVNKSKIVRAWPGHPPIQPVK